MTPSAIFALWNSARDAAADEYCRENRKQRAEIYIEEAKLKRAERARYFSARAYYGRAVKSLLASPTFDHFDPEVMERLRALHPEA